MSLSARVSTTEFIRILCKMSCFARQAKKSGIWSMLKDPLFTLAVKDGKLDILLNLGCGDFLKCSLPVLDSSDGEFTFDGMRYLISALREIRDPWVDVKDSSVAGFTVSNSCLNLCLPKAVIDRPIQRQSEYKEIGSWVWPEAWRYMRYITPCGSRDFSHFVWCGIIGDQLCLAVTDGHRLATTIQDEKKCSSSFLMPSCVADICYGNFRLFREYNCFDCVNHYRLVSDDIEVIWRQKCTYPDFLPVLNSDRSKSVAVQKAGLLAFCKVAVSVGCEKVHMVLPEDDVSMNLRSSSRDVFLERDLAAEGASFSTTLNTKYLCDVLKQTKLSGVKILFSSELSPVIVVAFDVTHLIMPLRSTDYGPPLWANPLH